MQRFAEPETALVWRLQAFLEHVATRAASLGVYAAVDTCGFHNAALYAVRRRDFAKVSKATARTMITPMMICWI